jgi:putative endonuclease
MLGLAGEEKAAAYLEAQGFTIKAQRFKTPYGEIDLIAEYDDMLVFVEVKQRRHAYAAYEAVTHRQQQRITQAAHYYMATFEGVWAQYASFRFDVVLLCSENKMPVHIESAWLSED